MSIFHQLQANQVLISAVLGFFVAQLVKFLIEFRATGKTDFGRLLGNGGMPSSHSATVTALSVSAAYCHGVSSFEFAISFILAMIVMTDAIGVRQETGKQSKLLNKMMETDFWKTEDSDLLPVKLKELVGHTPLQVMAGVVVGILVALVAEYGFYR